jgi:hypothetical protein
MGNLLKVLYRGDGDSQDIFVDFENCKPTDNELTVWTQVHSVLESSDALLKDLQFYAGASTEIRDAISNPRMEESQDKAWRAVVPLVSRLKQYFDFSISLETTVPNLLSVLCSNDMAPRQHLEMQQALFKQFAEIIDFTLKFDDLKMTNPAIQNDFSYYRRTLSRMKMAANESARADLEVTDAIASRMSLFYAHATPMLKVLSDATSKFVSENKDLPIENTTDCLSTMASICRVMIESPKYRSKFTSEETVMFCLRVMVGVIILYDHVHPVGAFAKTSPIDMKNSIRVLREQFPGKVDCLLNALRYTTRHLNDEATPRAIKSLLLA